MGKIKHSSTVDKVAMELIKNPLATQEEISLNIGVHRSNVSRSMKKAQEIAPKDERVINLTDTDFKILRLTQKETIVRLEDREARKEINSRDLTYIGDVAAKRYTIFRGEITDAQGGLKELIPADKDAVAQVLKENGLG